MVTAALDAEGSNMLDVSGRESGKFGWTSDDDGFVVIIGPGTIIDDVGGCSKVTVVPKNYN